jgi:hypothetical protein
VPRGSKVHDDGSVCEPSCHHVHLYLRGPPDEMAKAGNATLVAIVSPCGTQAASYTYAPYGLAIAVVLVVCTSVLFLSLRR